MQRALQLRRNRATASFILSLLVLCVAVLPPQAKGQDAAPGEGVNSGNYNIRQAAEFGYRFSDFTGSQSVFNTFVNLHTGPRLLEHTLEMRSLNHRGLLLDNFFLTSFGYDGDPNNVTLLRAYKNGWYNFQGTFRRDRNAWDYNLLANPLNPPNSSPFVPVTSSPHRFRLTRRMSDFHLVLFPESRGRLRLGYSRNINEGPSFTSFHEGTEVLVFQPWKTTLNSYHLGADFKLLPRTNISYDQFLHYYKGDTSWVDRDFLYQLPNGTPVDLGIIFNTAAGQPCTTPIANAATTPQTANPACTGYLRYERSGPVRTSYPTEQFSFQSRYFKNLDLAGRFVYSASENRVPVFREFFQGLVGRTQQRQFEIGGPASGQRISVTADLAATWHLNAKLRLVDTFRWSDFRLPGAWDSRESSLFGTSLLVPPNVFNPSACPSPFTAPGCPQHNANSPADLTSERFFHFLGQDAKNNLLELQYDFSKRLGGHLGYRHGNRAIEQRMFSAADLVFFPNLPNRGACAGLTLGPDGTCRVSTVEEQQETTVIREHSLVFGVSARPQDALRLGMDLELLSADRSFTRISPRQLQNYRFRASFQPRDWVRLAASVNIRESRNNVPQIHHLQHSRNYAFSATLSRGERWALDLGYDFSDVFSQTNICFVGTLRPPGTSPCPTVVALLEQISLYDSSTHFAHGSLLWRPAKRVTLMAGYAITSVDGSTLILNPIASLGPLQFSYHKPSASVAVDLRKGWTWKAGWEYYGYNEKAEPGPTAPRDFRGNLVMLSFRYSF